MWFLYTYSLFAAVMMKCYGSFLFHTADNLSNAQSGSSLSLASAATNEADSINSGGAGSQR